MRAFHENTYPLEWLDEQHEGASTVMSALSVQGEHKLLAKVLCISWKLFVTSYTTGSALVIRYY